MTEPLLEVESLRKTYALSSFLGRTGGKTLTAVQDATFHIAPGETFGLVGESGSGKTTISKVVLGLEPATAGTIRFQGNVVSGLPEKRLRTFRRSVQAVFQDPYSALNRRMRVGELVGEPLLLLADSDRSEREQRVLEVMQQVGLPADAVRRYPHEFSGGQRQRIAIARALSVQPQLVVLDEPVSALDVSIRAQVLNLLKDLQEQLGVSYLFIAHDLAVVQFMSHRVGVMYLGRLVEVASSVDLYRRPSHPYTVALLKAIPPHHPRDARPTAPLEGEIPSPVNPPSGCTFHPRCPLVEDRCRIEAPELREILPGQFSACHFAETVSESDPFATPTHNK